MPWDAKKWDTCNRSVPLCISNSVLLWIGQLHVNAELPYVFKTRERVFLTSSECSRLSLRIWWRSTSFRFRKIPGTFNTDCWRKSIAPIDSNPGEATLSYRPQAGRAEWTLSLGQFNVPECGLAPDSAPLYLLVRNSWIALHGLKIGGVAEEFTLAVYHDCIANVEHIYGVRCRGDYGKQSLFLAHRPVYNGVHMFFLLNLCTYIYDTWGWLGRFTDCLR